MRHFWCAPLLMLIAYLACPSLGLSYQKSEKQVSAPVQTFIRIETRWTCARNRSADSEANRITSSELTELCSLSDDEVLSVAKELNRTMHEEPHSYSLVLAFQIYLLLIYDTSAVPADQLEKYLFMIYVIKNQNKDVPEFSRENPWELKGQTWSLKPVTYGWLGGTSVDCVWMAGSLKKLPRRRFVGFWQRRSDSTVSPSVLLYTSNNASYSKLQKVQTILAKHCRRWSFDVDEVSAGKYRLSVYVDRTTFHDSKSLVSSLQKVK
jgi:hypothetical protein